MMRWILITLVCSALAVRRGAPLDMSAATGLQHVSSLLAQHESSSNPSLQKIVTASLAQMSVLANSLSHYTPGVDANLESVVKSLGDVIESIQKASSDVQDSVNEKVKSVNSTSVTARRKKELADVQHKVLYACRKEEQRLKNVVVQTQETYNVDTVATREPCQREITTSTFSLTTEKFRLDCDLSVDATCASNQQVVDGQITWSVETLANQVTGKVEAHNQATQDCSTANTTQINARTAVLDSRQNLTDQYNQCQLDQLRRHEAVCSFGDALQDACEAKSEFNALISKVQNSGYPESQPDREAELTTTSTVRCILQSFVENGNLTDSAVTACGNVDLKPLQIQLKSNVVQGYLEPQTSEFQIKCQTPDDDSSVGHEEITIGKDASMGKNITSNASYPLQYDDKLDKIEEVTRPTYEETIVHVETSQTEIFVVDQLQSPFSVCSDVEDNQAGDDEGNGKR